MQKRLFDISWALLSLALFPILLLFARSRTWVQNALAVLIGKKTLVGYATEAKSLPELKPSVYHTDFQLSEVNEVFQKNLDLLYAKNYSIDMDIRAILHRNQTTK